MKCSIQDHKDCGMIDRCPEEKERHLQLERGAAIEFISILFLVFEYLISHVGHLHLSKATLTILSMCLRTSFVRVLIESTFILLLSTFACARWWW